MKPFLLLFLAVSTSAHAQAVRPATVSVPRPPAYTPGYAPGTPPEPVYTPQGAGLPGEREPGTVAPPVPRSPNKRVLPPTKEPGLWAADGARASTDAPRIFGVPLPVADLAQSIKTVADLCSAGMAITLVDVPVDAVMSASIGVKQCAAARAFAHCARHYGDDAYWNGVREYRPTLRPAEVRRTVQPYADELVSKWCSGILLVPEQNDALAEVLEAWTWRQKNRD